MSDHVSAYAIYGAVALYAIKVWLEQTPIDSGFLFMIELVCIGSILLLWQHDQRKP